MDDRLEFAKRVLSNLEIPTRTKAANALLGWMIAESGANLCNGVPGNGARYNPLNTTKVMGEKCDISNYNSVGVKNYASKKCGVQATVATLENPRYRDVVRQLKRVIYPGWRNRFANAVQESGWGTSAAGVLAGIDAVEREPARWRNIPVG